MYKIEYGCHEWQECDKFRTFLQASRVYDSYLDKLPCLGAYSATYIILYKGSNIIESYEENDSKEEFDYDFN